MLPNAVEPDMKDVACLVYSTPKRQLWQYSFTVYLIDIRRQKVIAFLHLNEDCSSDVGFLVYKSMLYMFGGRDWRRKVNHADAYVLDLFQLAKTTPCHDHHDKPSPTKLAPMNYGKRQPTVLLVRNKICVFDAVGHESAGFHFELYDPDQNTWTKVPDPCLLSTRCFVDAHYVKDDKLFICIRKKEAVFVLNIGDDDTTSPSWSHIDISYLTYNSQGEGVIFGSWLVCLSKVYELGQKMCFARDVGSVLWSDKTAAKPYDVRYKFDAKMFRLGGDRVCLIQPAIIYKHHERMGKIKRVKMDGRRSMFMQQSLIRKWERERKGSLRLFVEVCRVDSSSAPDMQLELLKSFTVPMYRDNCKLKSYTIPEYRSLNERYGHIRMVSLCHP